MKDHAQNSKKKILESAELRALLGDRCVKFLADICCLHDKDISSVMDLPKEENGLFCDYFHPRFVAALLCLGDLLDMDTDRFDSTMLKATSPLPLFCHKIGCYYYCFGVLKFRR